MRASRTDSHIEGSSEPLLEFEQGFECLVERRVNRFVVEVVHAGNHHPVAMNNTGRLKELLVPGKRAWCVPNHRGKTWAKLVAVEDEWGWALIDTQRQMQAFEVALNRYVIPWLKGWTLIKRNPRLGKSVLDFYLENEAGAPLVIETKSAVYRDGRFATYPDCPSLRGRRHLRELISHARSGGTAAVVFVASLSGITAFKPSFTGDPQIVSLLREALLSPLSVKAISLECHVERGVFLADPNLPVSIE